MLDRPGLPISEDSARPSLPPAPAGTAGHSERDRLFARFRDRLVVRPKLNRRIVSYQANKTHPGLRWFKYKEGFSADLVRDFLDIAEGPVLDPFAGIGTTALVAGGRCHEAVGIEIMPVGTRAAQAVAAVADGICPESLKASFFGLLQAVAATGDSPAGYRFPHVRITEHAFSPETEAAIARARSFIAAVEDDNLRLVLDVACMSVLEEVSYTRKDGQYLRWDSRSGRKLRSGMNKGRIPGFEEALLRRIQQIVTDAPALKRLYGGHAPKIVEGSALRELPQLDDGSVGLTITSPPYANRYDYTRTYALELAWLGFDRDAFGRLRQDLVSATVENRSKKRLLDETYPRPDILALSGKAVARQKALAEALDALEGNRQQLSNPHVIRLVQNYFLEISLIIAELSRVTRTGGRVVMVNDNVQYHGEEIPVDLILSDIAEYCGFECEEISVLPRGKGNSSQQMGKFGRRELRKCVYSWRRT